ncbi:magnesium and cobalt transport protein CorA [Pelistega europaea]|uniref:Magnesium and cobalt transport protein CorA n=2 Tax=Pelistega europaea TaxID=106147 RepID=A0A7Y4P594_9BURK|nr:magnesium and cobalt transport protein CorA [Pelistega europaea]NOL50281.1 magnesium and cobalt transport protein CorA [Pelistega europaea]
MEAALEGDAVAKDEKNKKKEKKTGLIASVEYVHGKKREAVPLDKLSGYKKDPARLLWVGLKDPSPEELTKVCKDLSIIDEAAQEILEIHRKPKVIDYGNYIQLVAVTITKENKKLVFGEMQMIFGVGFVLTVRRGGAMTNSSLRERMESCPELIARGSDFVVAEILDVFVDSCAALASRLETEVNQVEQKMMLRGFKETDIRKLYKQRRDLLRIRTSITPMVEICRKIAVMNSPIIEPDSRSYFTIVADRIARIDEQIHALHEALAFAFEASLMIGQSHQTDVTKKLAAWAAILAVPTAVAGIYGMNFKYMPELNWTLGYPMALGLMGGICGFLYYRFKKSGWL